MLIQKSDRESLIQLIGFIASDARPAAEARFYFENPEEFVQSEYGEYCSYGEDETEDLLEDGEYLNGAYLWDVFEGILRTGKYMFRLDWRASFEDIKHAVTSLLSSRGITGYDPPWNQIEKGLPSLDILNFAAEDLNRKGLALVYLNDGSDSFPVVLIKKDDFKDFANIAEKIGIKAETHFS
jgi:hypothetical protein